MKSSIIYRGPSKKSGANIVFWLGSRIKTITRKLYLKCMEIESGDTFKADAKIGSFTSSHVFLPTLHQLYAERRSQPLLLNQIPSHILLFDHHS